MDRLILTAALALWPAVALAEAPPQATLDAPPQAQLNEAPDPLKASVRVDVDLGGGRAAHGSGTVVAVEDGTALVVTNRHVVPADGTITVRWPDGTGAIAEWLGVDATADLCALRVRAPAGCVACPVADAIPLGGDRLVQVGYPNAVAQPVRREGPAVNWEGTTSHGGTPVFQANVRTSQGDSGSGVFDARGHLVAVVWGTSGGVTVQAVPAAHVRRFLLRDRIRGLFPRLAASLDERRAAMAPVAVAVIAPPVVAEKPPQATLTVPVFCPDHPYEWKPDAGGSSDLGLWQGGRFYGRWYPGAKVYQPWDGQRYGPSEAVPPVALPVTTPARPAAVVVPPGSHAHRTIDGRTIIHSDANYGDPAAHRGIAAPWPKVAFAGQVVACPGGR